MNRQDFVDQIENTKTRFNRLPEDRQRRIIRKANRVVNTDLKDVKDFWVDIKKLLKQ